MFDYIEMFYSPRASVKDTCCAILERIGYPSNRTRSEHYLINCNSDQLQHHGIAAIHLDEVQDVGHHAMTTARSNFAKRSRNLMQNAPWPVCLILSSVPEVKDFVNHDLTLTRRLKVIEIPPTIFRNDGPTLRLAVERILSNPALDDQGMVAENEFIKVLIHASAYRFGVAIELEIESIGEAISNKDQVIDLDHLAEAYRLRMSCDDGVNPCISEQWKAIDTTVAMQRNLDGKKTRPAPKRRK